VRNSGVIEASGKFSLRALIGLCEQSPPLAGALRSAAAATGAEYLDLTDAFDGHQLCDRRAERVGSDGPSPLTAEWFRRLLFTQGSTRESLHPNAYGQKVIGQCLGLLYERQRGDYACTDTPGEWLGGVHLEVAR